MDDKSNTKGVFTLNGCSNHSLKEREIHDFYATNPIATQGLLEVEFFDKNMPILEPCAGQRHISKILVEKGYKVQSSDLYDRGYCESGIDFIKDIHNFKGNIITNPPYKYSLKFLKHAYNILEEGYKLAFFLKLTFLEGKERRLFFDENPPKTIYVSTNRIHGYKHGEKQIHDNAVAYMWLIMEKGYKGETVVKWFN